MIFSRSVVYGFGQFGWANNCYYGLRYVTDKETRGHSPQNRFPASEDTVAFPTLNESRRESRIKRDDILIKKTSKHELSQ